MVSFMENPINMDDLGVPPWIGNLHRLSNWKHVGLPCRKEAATKDWRRMSSTLVYIGFPAVCDILLAEYREYLG